MWWCGSGYGRTFMKIMGIWMDYVDWIPWLNSLASIVLDVGLEIVNNAFRLICYVMYTDRRFQQIENNVACIINRKNWNKEPLALHVRTHSTLYSQFIVIVRSDLFSPFGFEFRIQYVNSIINYKLSVIVLTTIEYRTHL